jgi:uncharacterized membrane protein
LIYIIQLQLRVVYNSTPIKQFPATNVSLQYIVNKTNMALKISSSFCNAVGLGLIAGMRTFMVPAVLSHMYSRHPSQNIESSPIKFIQTIPASNVCKVLAVGELIGDKLPTAPNRTGWPGLTGRILSGAFGGATLYRADGKNVFWGGVIGGTAALASTFGCFFLRTAIDSKKFVPNAVVGACEDVIAVSIGVGIASNQLK